MPTAAAARPASSARSSPARSPRRSCSTSRTWSGSSTLGRCSRATSCSCRASTSTRSPTCPPGCVTRCSRPPSGWPGRSSTGSAPRGRSSRPTPSSASRCRTCTSTSCRAPRATASAGSSGRARSTPPTTKRPSMRRASTAVLAAPEGLAQVAGQLGVAAGERVGQPGQRVGQPHVGLDAAPRASGTPAACRSRMTSARAAISSRCRATNAVSTRVPWLGTTTASDGTALRCRSRVAAQSNGHESDPSDGSADSSMRSPRKTTPASGTQIRMSPSVCPRPACARCTTRSPRSTLAAVAKVTSGPRGTVSSRSRTSCGRVARVGARARGPRGSGP